jgi:hypothetical protein
MKPLKKCRKEKLVERIEKDENAWVKLSEAINMQLGDIAKYYLRLEDRIKAVEKEIEQLKAKGQ